jgi:DNA-binding transcriptional MerR regulator
MIAVNTYQTVSIGEAARQTGASIKQIRNWADIGIIELPDRVQCGERAYRQYSQTDLETIQSIKAYLDEGYTLRAAARKADEEKSNNRRK